MNSKPIRLFVVDDHPIVLAGLRMITECARDIEIVGEARTRAEALAKLPQSRADIALLDIRLREDDGIELCRSLKSRWPSLRVLMITSFADAQTVLAALEAGADGYLLKESDATRLITAVRDVMRGETVIDPAAVSKKQDLRVLPNDSGALGCLSAQERKLPAEIAQGKTDKEAAAALGLTPKTTRNYLDRIFAKLNVHTRTEAATLFVRSQLDAPRE